MEALQAANLLVFGKENVESPQGSFSCYVALGGRNMRLVTSKNMNRILFAGFFIMAISGCRLVMDIPDEQPNRCGDNVRQGQEMCDGLDLGGATCESLELGTGTLVCNLSCSGFITEGCQAGPVCGDDSAEAPEVCDGSDLNDVTCETLGHMGGTLACDDECSGYDESGCHDCGNGVLDFGEVCDGGDLGGATCQTRGFPGGTLACKPACDGFDESGCYACGNGRVEPTESCDDNNTSPGDGCSATCQVEPYWSCTGQPSFCTTACGDGHKRGSEGCDDGDLDNGDGCSSTCTVETGWSCTGTDPSVCTPVCGDGYKRGAEACDDGDLDNGDGCSSTCMVELGWSCTGTDPSDCTPICGDDQALGTEPCDGADLKSMTCYDLGYCGGTLSCKPDCSDFNKSNCMSGEMCK